MCVVEVVSPSDVRSVDPGDPCVRSCALPHRHLRLQPLGGRCAHLFSELSNVTWSQSEGHDHTPAVVVQIDMRVLLCVQKRQTREVRVSRRN